MVRIIAVLIGIVMLAVQGFFPSSEVLAIVASAIWPFCFLYAVCTIEKTKKTWLLLPALYVGFALKYLFTLGNVSKGIIVMLITSIAISFIIFLVYFLYGIAYKKINNPLVTLIFPILLCAVQLVFSQLMHLGNIMNPAVAVINIPVVLQSASLIGEIGLSFVLFWMYAAITYIINRRKKISGIVLSVICVCIVAFVIIFGSIRLSKVSDKPDNIKVAALMTLKTSFFDEIGKHKEEDYIEAFAKNMKEAASEKADLVITNEEYAFFNIDNFDEYMEKIKAIIKETHIPTLFCVAKYHLEEGQTKLDNHALLFDENGNLLYEYAKHNRILLVETFSVTKGDDIPGEAIVTIKGKPRKVAISICFDLNDEIFMNKISDDVDLILAPAWDWKNVCYTQPRHTVVRAVEKGITLIKATYEGYLYVADEYGIIRDYDSSIGADNQTIFLEVPVE